MSLPPDPIFPPDAYDRLDALTRRDPELVHLIVWLVTADARSVKQVARQFFEEASLTIDHARGLLRVIDMPDPEPAAPSASGVFA